MLTNQKAGENVELDERKKKIIFLIVSIFSVLFCDAVYASETLYINSRKVKMSQSELENLRNLGFK